MRDLALISGSARRLGKAMALELAQRGCDIAVHSRSSDAQVCAVVAEIQSCGVDARAFEAALEGPTAAATLVADVAKAFGRPVNVLVNSASTFGDDDLATTSHDALAAHYALNTIQPVLLTQALAAAYQGSSGLIVNILDQKLYSPYADNLAYTLSKYALQGFTLTMARALAPRFRVNGIAPGYTIPGPREAASTFARLHDDTPLGRGPTPEDICGALGYLWSAPAVTGQVIIVDGGMHMRAQDRDFEHR